MNSGTMRTMSNIEGLKVAIHDLRVVIDKNAGKQCDVHIADAHDIAIAMFVSALSLHGISLEPQRFEVGNDPIELYPHGLAMLTCREIFEKYLLFARIYKANGEYSKYNHLKWKICGYSHANKLANISKENIEAHNSNTQDRERFIEEIEQTIEYKSKAKNERKAFLTRLRDGKDNEKNVKNTLCECGYHRIYSIYQLLCDYAHSGALSIGNIACTTKQDDQYCSLNLPINISKMFIYMFVKQYCIFFDLSKKLTAEHPDVMERMTFFCDLAAHVEKLFKPAEK